MFLFIIFRKTVLLLSHTCTTYKIKNMYTHSNNSVDSNSTKLEPPHTMLNINYSDREYFQQGSNFGENWARLNQLYQHS